MIGISLVCGDVFIEGHTTESGDWKALTEIGVFNVPDLEEILQTTFEDLPPGTARCKLELEDTFLFANRLLQSDWKIAVVHSFTGEVHQCFLKTDDLLIVLLAAFDKDEGEQYRTQIEQICAGWPADCQVIP